MPIWAEEKLKNLVEKYSGKKITKEELSNMRAELQSIGLERLLPDALNNVITKPQ